MGKVVMFKNLVLVVRDLKGERSQIGKPGDRGKSGDLICYM